MPTPGFSFAALALDWSEPLRAREEPTLRADAVDVVRHLAPAPD